MTSGPPPVVCIVGRKNAGKTELTVSLASELTRRGYRVMTAKHGHGFQLDQPGRGSWRHRHEGGAVRTVLAGPSDFGVMGHWPDGEMPLAELVRRFLWDADVVLAEGFKAAPEPKIEVCRGLEGREPWAGSDAQIAAKIVALVTDQPGSWGDVPVFLLSSPGYVGDLADFLAARFLVEKENGG